MTQKIEKHTISEKADIMHRASSLYMASNIPIDYGTGEMYTPVEVHMLNYIKDHPGKNVTELSNEWDKTKAAISQMLKKMEQKNLIFKKKPINNFRKQCFFVTEKGQQLCECHEDYDTKVFGETLKMLKEFCTEDEINICFSVLEKYAEVRQKKHYSKE